MKIKKIGLLVSCLAGIAFWCGCSRHPQEATPTETAGEKAGPAKVQHGTNGESILTLTPETQTLMGLQTATLSPAQLNPELKAYGRVLDPSPLVPLVAECQTAKAAKAASQAELRRIQTLKAQDNTSDRVVQAAETAAARDAALWDSARLRLLSGWGAAIAEQADLAGFVASLASQQSVLLEMVVPAGEAPAAPPVGARVSTLANETKTAELRWLGPAPSAPPQERSYWFLLESNTLHLAPGAAVTGFLRLPGDPEPGVIVPLDAILLFQGARWLYVQTDGTTFQRQELLLERPCEGGWFVRRGLQPGAKVVTTGAQQLLSEELKGSAE